MDYNIDFYLKNQRRNGQIIIVIMPTATTVEKISNKVPKKESIGIFSNPVVTPIKKTMAQTIATMVSSFVHLYCLNFIFITHSSSFSLYLSLLYHFQGALPSWKFPHEKSEPSETRLIFSLLFLVVTPSRRF